MVKRGVSRAPLVGTAAYDVLHGIKSGLKDVLAPQGMFSDLGLKYVGPIDGHDIAAVERALLQAKQFGGPVLVHCLTRKGNGFKAAEDARGGPLPRRRQDRRRHRAAAGRAGRARPGPTSSPTSSSGSARGTSGSSPSPPR